MERTTKSDARRHFQWLLEALGKREASTYNDVGGWRLDYAPYYGGYRVVEITNEGGAERHPIFRQRLSAREFCQCVQFFLSTQKR